MPPRPLRKHRRAKLVSRAISAVDSAPPVPRGGSSLPTASTHALRDGPMSVPEALPGHRVRLAHTSPGAQHFDGERRRCSDARNRGLPPTAGETISQTRRTVDEAAPELVDGMRDGSIVNRSRRPYKPAAVRSYERALQMRLLPVFGSRRLAEVKAGDVQRFPEALLRDGLNASSARTTLHPLRVIYRRAVRLGGSATTRRRRSSCRPRRVGAGAWSRRRGRWHSSSRWPPANRHSGRLRCSSGCAAASFAPSDGPTSSSQPAP